MKWTLAGLLSTTLLNGCGTLMTPEMATIRVTSVPTGASVYVEGRGKAFGQHISGLTTPCNVQLNQRGIRSYRIRISKDEYLSSESVIGSEENQWCSVGNAFSFSLLGLIVDFNTGAWQRLPTKPIHAVLQPIPVISPAPPLVPKPPPVPVPKPVPETAPALVEGKNPLRIEKWDYDQDTQKAEFEFSVVSEDADIFALRPWALQQIRKICNDEYAQSSPSRRKDLLGFTLVTKLDRPKFTVYVTIHHIRPMSHSYDAATRTGTLKVNIGKQGDANYADAYKWALANIGVICSSKEVAVEAGQLLPEGAMYEILSETTGDDGTLEIRFRVIQ